MQIRPKFYFPEIAIGIFLTVAIFAMGMMFESSRSHPRNENAASHADPSSGVITAKEPENKLTDWLLVLFNGLLFGSTVLLWGANNRSAKIAERALTQLEAPFIYVKIKSEDMIHRNGRASGTLRLLFGNYGHTPAYILEYIDHIKTVSIDDGPQPKIIDPDTQHGTVMPYGVVAPPDGVSQDFHHPFVELVDKRNLFLIGYVRYADIFDRSYTLGFCYKFESKRFRWVLSGGDGYNYCRQDSGPNQPPAWFTPSAHSGNLSGLPIQLGLQQAIRDRQNPND